MHSEQLSWVSYWDQMRKVPWYSGILLVMNMDIKSLYFDTFKTVNVKGEEIVFLTIFLIHLLACFWSPREYCALSWQIAEWEQHAHSLWQDCPASPVQRLGGHSCTSMEPKNTPKLSTKWCSLCWPEHALIAIFSIEEYSCRCCCTVDQAFCWAAFKYTKHKCIMAFQLNLSAGLVFNIMRNLNYGGPCKFYLEQ